ncbi:hypothetical protein Efla_003916 [Eimeria flavescens]
MEMQKKLADHLLSPYPSSQGQGVFHLLKQLTKRLEDAPSVFYFERDSQAVPLLQRRLPGEPLTEGGSVCKTGTNLMSTLKKAFVEPAGVLITSSTQF